MKLHTYSDLSPSEITRRLESICNTGVQLFHPSVNIADAFTCLTVQPREPVARLLPADAGVNHRDLVVLVGVREQVL